MPLQPPPCPPTIPPFQGLRFHQLLPVARALKALGGLRVPRPPGERQRYVRRPGPGFLAAHSQVRVLGVQSSGCTRSQFILLLSSGHPNPFAPLIEHALPSRPLAFTVPFYRPHPPSFRGPIIATQTCLTTSLDPPMCELSYTQGVASNTNYVVYLTARDTFSNVQRVSKVWGWAHRRWIGRSSSNLASCIHTSPSPPWHLQSFTQVVVHTDDNNPPTWVDYAVRPQPDGASFTIQVRPPLDST